MLPLGGTARSALGAHMNPSLPQDAALPQLSLVLDGAAMAEVFADVLRPHGMRVEACSVERVKYRPGRNATLAYRLMLRDPQQRTTLQHVAARLCGGDGAQRTVKASAASLAASPAGPALRWLPALDMLTWWWPNDAKLRAPRLLACEHRLRHEALPALLPLLGVPRQADVGIDLDIVQYVPEHRLCGRVDLQWRDGGAMRTQRVYAKASREPDGATAHDLLAQLQASAVWREGRLHTPRALLWHAPTELYWQEGLPGRPLQDMGAAVAACAPALGAQIAALHATPLQTPRETTRDDMRARLMQVVERLMPVLDGDALHRAAQAIDSGWHALDGLPMATLHGDLHARNILVAGPRVSLIDLDSLHRGPALLELGAWVADAMYHALLDGARAERDQSAWCALLDAYADAGGMRCDPRALRWATAWSLITQRAWRCVINLKPGRFALAPRLVALAADLVGVREAASC
jgi:hypothetical protein